MARSYALPPSLPPRGLCREVAAQYISVSVGKWDALVKDRRMPRPRRIDGRLVWDREEIDRAFYALPHDGEGLEAQAANPWDGAR